MNFIRKKHSSALKFILPITSLLIFVNAFSQERDISCTITKKLITIRNANTTIRINNDIEFEMFFEKDGVSSRLIKENNKYYKNWDKMMIYHPKAGATWSKPRKEYISQTNRLLRNAGEFLNLQHIMNKYLRMPVNDQM